MNNNNSSNNTKFRPCLSAAMIEHILQLCMHDNSFASYDCITTLRPYMNKIQSGLVSPSVIIGQPRVIQSNSQSMQGYVTQQANQGGMVNPVDIIAELAGDSDRRAMESPQQRKMREAYELYTSNPSAVPKKAAFKILKYRDKLGLLTQEENAELVELILDDELAELAYAESSVMQDVVTGVHEITKPVIAVDIKHYERDVRKEVQAQAAMADNAALFLSNTPKEGHTNTSTNPNTNTSTCISAFKGIGRSIDDI